MHLYASRWMSPKGCSRKLKGISTTKNRGVTPRFYSRTQTRTGSSRGAPLPGARFGGGGRPLRGAACRLAVDLLQQGRAVLVPPLVLAHPPQLLVGEAL